MNPIVLFLAIVFLTVFSMVAYMDYKNSESHKPKNNQHRARKKATHRRRRQKFKK